jgi:tRNA/tmRNA/rRNA uracil-C5-methylase (TrmA/RlmC/RlmD family)
MRKNRSKNKTRLNLTREPAKLKPTHLNGCSVESLDIEAQGVAHKADGKVVFIDGALPFEVVSANVNRKKDNWEKATLLDSQTRIVAACHPCIARILACIQARVEVAKCSTCTLPRKWR